MTLLSPTRSIIQASLPLLPANVRSTIHHSWFRYEPGPCPFRLRPSEGRRRPSLPPNADATLDGRIQKPTPKIAGPASLLIDTTAVYPSNWHSLGGSSMLGHRLRRGWPCPRLARPPRLRRRPDAGYHRRLQPVDDDRRHRRAGQPTA